MATDEKSATEFQHEQAPITYEGEVIFTVDAKLRSLIQYLVDKSIETFNGCENTADGMVWIEFELEDWMFINESSFDSESRELHAFIKEHCGVELLSHDDGEPDEKDELWVEGSYLFWSASVTFPKELLNRFEQLVRFTIDHVETTAPNSIH